MLLMYYNFLYAISKSEIVKHIYNGLFVAIRALSKF